MYNWSIDEKKLAKKPREYAIWKLEQMVNFGLGKDKLSRQELLKYWNEIKIDPARKKFLRLILDEK
ncbi:MAG: hypothetical protein UR98_C0009G0020 [Parcubacteria group bacterium GW2011_GWA1_36_12]|nr:MAG: hypothetical protein UR98_C0009G0020 [Parcubacteria group bacterium GW2011_GWA1_36_12]